MEDFLCRLKLVVECCKAGGVVMLVDCYCERFVDEYVQILLLGEQEIL